MTFTGLAMERSTMLFLWAVHGVSHNPFAMNKKSKRPHCFAWNKRSRPTWWGKRLFFILMTVFLGIGSGAIKLWWLENQGFWRDFEWCIQQFYDGFCFSKVGSFQNPLWLLCDFQYFSLFLLFLFAPLCFLLGAPKNCETGLVGCCVWAGLFSQPHCGL